MEAVQNLRTAIYSFKLRVEEHDQGGVAVKVGDW
jgi:hypothetical protein